MTFELKVFLFFCQKCIYFNVYLFALIFGRPMAYGVPGPATEPVSQCSQDAANPVACATVGAPIFFLFFFFLATPKYVEFPGQGSDLNPVATYARAAAMPDP